MTDLINMRRAAEGVADASLLPFRAVPGRAGVTRMDEPEEADAKAQGRRPRGGRDIGRERLIESTRGAMRARPKLDIQRNEIAKHAGVTPALVSYYFPDRTQLLEVAARPVIENWAAEIRTALASEAAPIEKLKRIVTVFLEFNSEQGFIIDHYIEISNMDQSDPHVAMLNDTAEELSIFCRELIDLNLVKTDDQTFLPAALWGLCRYVGRRGEADMFKDDGGFSAAPSVLADKVLQLVLV